ncbi:hypothetical protein RFI_18651, partial [Reticulomyxa filosa]
MYILTWQGLIKNGMSTEKKHGIYLKMDSMMMSDAALKTINEENEVDNAGMTRQIKLSSAVPPVTTDSQGRPATTSISTGHMPVRVRNAEDMEWIDATQYPEGFIHFIKYLAQFREEEKEKRNKPKNKKNKIFSCKFFKLASNLCHCHIFNSELSVQHLLFATEVMLLKRAIVKFSKTEIKKREIGTTQISSVYAMKITSDLLGLASNPAADCWLQTIQSFTNASSPEQFFTVASNAAFSIFQ